MGTELSRTRRVLFADNICLSLNIYYFSNGGICKNFRYITSMLGNSQQAVKDYKTAARLGNEMAQDYLRSQGIHW
jgi:hypothetical protein